MLRLFFSILCIVWIFNTKSVAQNNSLILGVSGGTSLSKMKHDGDFTFGSGNEIDSRKIGYGGGIDLGIKVGKFSFLSGFKYNIRNAQNEIQLLDQKIGLQWVYFDENTTQLSYGRRLREYSFSTFTIPLNLRYEFGGEVIKFFLQAGLNINLIQNDGKISGTFELDTPGASRKDENYKLSKGVTTVDLLKSKYSSFVLSPGILYSLNDNGLLKFNIIFENGRDLNNTNYIDNVSNGEFVPGIYQVESQLNGSLRSSSISFEIGYEHRFNFELGSKY